MVPVPKHAFSNVIKHKVGMQGNKKTGRFYDLDFWPKLFSIYGAKRKGQGTQASLGLFHQTLLFIVNLIMSSYIKKNDLFFCNHEGQSNTILISKTGSPDAFEFSAQRVQFKRRLKGIFG
jgi:hypothetical protein